MMLIITQEQIQIKKSFQKLIDIIFGNQSLGSYAQNITTFSNTATNPSQLYPSMSKALPSMQTHGEISGKNTRERAIDVKEIAGND